MTQRAWVATRKGLFEMNRSGDAWTIGRVSFLGEPVTTVLPPRASAPMLAALNLGHFGVKLHASDDAGVTWREVATPAYPPQPDGVPGPAWKLVQIWSLQAQGDTVWAGTLPGGLFRSRDAGESWQLVESLWMRPERTEWFGGGYDVPGIHSICPHPARSGELLVGVSCGGAWVTPDGGETWSLRAKGMRADFMPPEKRREREHPGPALDRAMRGVARRVVVPASQRHLAFGRQRGVMAGGHQRPGVELRLRGGRASDDADTAWFAPAEADACRVPKDGALVVNRTRDAGRSFETLRAGLPQSNCYDLAYRHGLVAADDGRTLLMGTTTGGLWASADGGDRWSTVSTNLPPIYAVRFG